MNMAALKKKLPKNFYIRDVLTVAKELLGKVLVYQDGNKKLSGKIVEVEAYRGSVDQAAHSFNGKTKRNEVMFEEGGLLYVYFTYGVHFCCNVVTGKPGKGDAVLLRALEPVSGIEEMATNRFNKKKINEKELINLTNGPGKICQAFNFNRAHNRTDLTGKQIYILDNEKIMSRSIAASTRIGIKKSVDLPWRFYIKNNPFVSKK
jgi:DNA-3-methyladenine glycosylase